MRHAMNIRDIIALARNSNFSVLKLFPAEQAGGMGILLRDRDV